MDVNKFKQISLLLLMSFQLSLNTVLDIIKNKKTNITKDDLLINLKKLFDLTASIISFLKKNNINGFEKDTLIGINSESSGITTGQGANPLLWAIGHFCYFYEFHCFKYLIRNYKFFISDGELYDSFVSDRPYRFNYRPHSKSKIFEYFDYIKTKMYDLIDSHELTNSTRYLFLLSILHHHMHCESIIFTKKLLGFKLGYTKNIFINSKKNSLEFTYIKVNGGYFEQGNIEGENMIAFDNEMPRFKTFINNFHVSKYCVTESIVQEFIKNNGYSKKEFWCNNGWRWKNENNITLPFYWVLQNNNYFINDNSKLRPISHNNPICHISWYEACAIAKWMGGRLPTESEWEYMATNSGRTKFPWGNKMIESNANFNYSGNICNVDIFSSGDNHSGIRQLFGNVWEWCMEPLYPYNGFKIDPVYREFSYPFFGFKKILRGGCWAVPSILINSRYRNAQMPDCRIQFTGFRVVKDYL